MHRCCPITMNMLETSSVTYILRKLGAADRPPSVAVNPARPVPPDPAARHFPYSAEDVGRPLLGAFRSTGPGLTRTLAGGQDGRDRWQGVGAAQSWIAGLD